MTTKPDQLAIRNASRPGWWSRIFFTTDVPYGLALLRMYLPLVMLIDITHRWPFVRELYSSDGAPAPLADNFGYLNWLPILPGTAAVALYAALVFCLVTSSVGWCTRFSLAVTAVLYPYFTLLDCITTLTKYTVICSHLLLVLTFSHAGAVWSVDSWLRRRGLSESSPGSDESAPAAFFVWPQRLIQILLCAVYFGAAMTKMHTSAFLTGDQLLYWMMTYVNSPHPVGEYLTQFPLLLVVCSYVTLVWETVFPFVVFQRRLKWPALAIGAIFHVMTALTLGLYIFPQVMLAAYCSFLTGDDIRSVSRFARRARFRAEAICRRIGLSRERHAAPAIGPANARPALFTSPAVPHAAFGLALGLFSVAGVEVEYRADPYGERGPAGPLALRELNADEVERLLEPATLRQVDKFFAFDLGGRIIGDHLVNHRRSFRQGETLFAQVCLNQPHEDMWLDCTLTDRDGKPLYRYGQVAMREAFRVHFTLPIDCALPAGEYDMVLNNAGQEIMRRRFTVEPSPSSAHAGVAPAAN